MEVIKLKVPDVATAIGVLGASLKRELFLLDKSIVDTKKKKLQVVEEKNGMRSEGFFDKFDKGLVGDGQAAILWAAEFEALKLLEKERGTIERMLSQCK